MHKSYRLTPSAKNYLTEFYCILDTMASSMTEQALTDSISHNFILQMIPHHRAAIEMSHDLLRYTAWEPLENIALGIIAEQTKSIRDMQHILCPCQKQCNSRQDFCLWKRGSDQIMDRMFSDMGRAFFTNDINADFIREMIPHHRGTVEMSFNALQYELCPGLYPILEAIIASQEKGIREMQELLDALET